MTRVKPFRALVLAMALPCAGVPVLATASFARDTAIPAMDIPAAFDGDTGSASTPLPADGWWTIYQDPELDRLIAQVHATNTSIEQAAARVPRQRHRRASEMQPSSRKSNSMRARGQANGPLINEAGSNGGLLSAHATISWEADLLGRLSSDRRADRFDAKAAEALLADVRLLIETDAAKAYFEAVYLAKAITEAQRRAALLDERLAIQNRRFELGLIDRPSLNDAQRARDESQHLVEQLVEARAGTARRMAFLLGETRSHDMQTRDMPAAPLVPAGMPSNLLVRRSDVAAAIARLEASANRLQAEKNSWFPRFTLTASGGAASPSLGQILSSTARDFGLSALLSLPIFDGGRRKAALAVRNAEQDLAASEYRESVLRALREVNDHLGAFQLGNSDLALANSRLASGSSTTEILIARQANGTVARADVINSQLRTCQFRLDELTAQHRQLATSIDLIKALGGSW
ncbi:MAG: TolC family protein [Sphingomonadales bacterium]|nr:TolC family protein [Sphingomonadales bacterium]